MDRVDYMKLADHGWPILRRLTRVHTTVYRLTATPTLPSAPRSPKPPRGYSDHRAGGSNWFALRYCRAAER